MDEADMDVLQDLLDEAVLVFDDSDRLTLTLIDGPTPARTVAGSWSLSEMVDGMLDVMESDEEADDMLDLSRHFSVLAKRIRQSVGDHVTAPRGES